jgi:glucose/arabinose dehydrogenase
LNMRKKFIIFSALLLLPMVLGVTSCGKGQSQQTQPQAQAQPQPPQPGVNSTGLPLSVPDGFSMSIYANNLGSPRAIAWDPDGVMLVSCTQQGKVIALPDKDGNGVADEQVAVISGLNLPHGMAFSSDGTLYIAETDQVAAYDYARGTYKATNKRKIVDLPGGGEHFTRTIIFRPPPNDNQLLISVGSDCNVCHESDPRRAAILVVNSDGSGMRVFASGLRNSVFMAVHPVTHDVWATENGRDNLGDNIPPDEINIINDGNDYGWPTCYGKNIHDSQFDPNPSSSDPTAGKTPSYIDIQAHSAPLGLDFFPQQGWSSDYAYNLLVCYHGSWNRSVPTGDKAVIMHLDENGNYLDTQDFITGWMTSGGQYLGRPVGVSIRTDGGIYITDDQAGYVYLVKKTS